MSPYEISKVILSCLPSVLVISYFVKGSTLIDIREYYGSDGDEKPGKKGIALSVEQVRRQFPPSLRLLKATSNSGRASCRHQRPSVASYRGHRFTHSLFEYGLITQCQHSVSLVKKILCLLH